MYWKGRHLILWILCLFPAACASLGPQSDPSRFFALASLPRSEQRVQDATGTNALALGIGPIKFPAYLDRQEVVTRISQNRFAVAENDRWAEPLEENFSRILSQNLSILLHTERVFSYPWGKSQWPTYQVQVEVLRFEPNAERVVELWTRWSITDHTRKLISVRESYLTQTARDKSTEASVASMSEVASDLSKEIADAVRGLTSGQGR